MRALRQAGLPALLARLYAARGVASADQLTARLQDLLPFDGLLAVHDAARLLADAVTAGKKILIVADYDCDGATACAVGVRALRAFGARVEYLVPNRMIHGYGLTPEIVRLAHARSPDWIVTVDNGIASVEGVEEAHRLGIPVLVTDHHLPGGRLPRAACVVNPNQPGCGFPSKHLAGVGVMFYVMLALRAELRARGAGGEGPDLRTLLDLVALGTVADVVPLDANNRRLVGAGLARVRRGQAQAGVDALLRLAGRDPARAGAFDLGFCVGPRVNAAGRLGDMTLGIECLIEDDAARAGALAEDLDGLNRERQRVTAEMQAEAEAACAGVDGDGGHSLCLFDPGWHPGVVGLVAARLKERTGRPTLAFAPTDGGELRGSGRSVPGLHLRDALDRVAKREPGLILRFGGHAMAAGLSLHGENLERFRAAFEAVARELLSPADLAGVVETDGELPPAEMNLATAELLDAQVWGQGFPAPAFCNDFEVLEQRVVGGRHLKLVLAGEGGRFDAIFFGREAPLPARGRAVYALEANEFRGARSLQLRVTHWV